MIIEVFLLIARKITVLMLVALLMSCSEPPKFQLLSSERTGIDFSNSLTESESFNVMSYEYIYNGAGTGVGDLNNDGLADIVFAGNQVSPKVYLNQGNFKFKDITKNLQGLASQWYSSVSLADVNNDGWLDIYITATTSPDPEQRRNRLWINGGAKNGEDPIFMEMAEKYGVADTGFATNAGFLDYDLDGDLDLYILNNTVTTRMMSNYRQKLTDGSAPNNDKLYRNNGDGTFTDVTIEAGIVYEGYGLGVAFGDMNKDGFPDIYVSNDFMSNDLFYINQGDGTFKNEIRKYMSYQSKSSMGDDIADINDDGFLDVFTLDMMPEAYAKKKQTINGFSYIFYVNDEKFGYEHQYLRNMLHLHNGFMNGEMLPFSETGQMLGIYQTDWSWSALFADYDNDADKDLIVTNGFPKDMTDKDWTRLKVKSAGFYASDNTLIDMAPAVKIPNVVYENMGDLRFKKRPDWMPQTPSYSYGASFADFDNDGDLDYVINNINDEAFILRNNTVENDRKNSNYLRIRLKGKDANTMAIGAKIELWCNGKFQYAENFLTRGYASSVEPVIHFGLAGNDLVDSVRITWPSDRSTTVLRNIEANQVLDVIGENTKPSMVNNGFSGKGMFQKAEGVLSYVHHQNDFVDYGLSQRIIPHKFSQIGPRMAKGDLNNDGQEDLIIGSTNSMPTSVFLRKGNGFEATSLEGLTIQKEFSEAALAILDIDNDGDNDVLSAAGGYENPDQNSYRHYIYKNNNGKFIREDLPVPAFSASVIRPCDFDHDGHTDLFIGSRIKNGMFPYATHSWIIRNDNGNLKADSTSRFDLGMVTDAVWIDYDNDGWEDLLVAREWNTLAVLKNDGGKKLVPMVLPGMEKYPGIWYSLAAADFDQDGDIDFIAGNLGNNTRFNVSEKEPLSMYAFDFELDGIIDPVMTAYWPNNEGVMTEYPVNYLDELWSQSVFFQKVFKNYSTFSNTTMSDILSDEILKNLNAKQNVNTTSSYYIRNDKGNFVWEELPRALQVSPITKMIVRDLNNDGYPDVIIGGNDYSWDVPTGYFDANKGFVMMNKGRNSVTGEMPFSVLGPSESGMLLQGMVESLLWFEGDTPLVVAGFNRSDAVVYQLNK